jgi:high-affinity nickel-transport protein
MLRLFKTVFNDGSVDLRRKVAGIYAILIGGNILAWLWAFVAFRDHPALLGAALLAYTFGLRHAVDADHIAAIDNVTRKLMQEGKRPVAVGLFFSLGHSTVVIAMSVAVAVAAAVLQSRFAAFKDVGAVVGTSASAFFLFVIAIANILILGEVYRAFRAVRRGGALAEQDLDAILDRRGVMARLFRPLFRMVGRSWHLFPIGLLFGLGFETATEVALFGISGAEAAKGLSVWSVLVFPALFTAGMTLIDSTDGILMLGAYGWAFTKPIRKLYYNLTITSISVVVALVVGGIETLGLIGDRMGLDGQFWTAVGAVNGHFGLLGYGIVGIFVLGWALSAMVYRFKRYDALEISG